MGLNVNNEFHGSCFSITHLKQFICTNMKQIELKANKIRIIEVKYFLRFENFPYICFQPFCPFTNLFNIGHLDLISNGKSKDR